jgi:hypothetical protein
VVNVASTSRFMEFNFHWEKEISSVQTARPGQQLRYLSPEASHHLSRHCVHTPLFLPHDTLQTMQHVINAIHCTVCLQQGSCTEYLPLLPWAGAVYAPCGDMSPFNPPNSFHY